MALMWPRERRETIPSLYLKRKQNLRHPLLIKEDQMNDANEPHPGMTMNELIGLRQAEPDWLANWRKQRHLAEKKARLAAKGIKIVAGKPIQVSPVGYQTTENDN